MLQLDVCLIFCIVQSASLFIVCLYSRINDFTVRAVNAVLLVLNPNCSPCLCAACAIVQWIDNFFSLQVTCFNRFYMTGKDLPTKSSVTVASAMFSVTWCYKLITFLLDIVINNLELQNVYTVSGKG